MTGSNELLSAAPPLPIAEGKPKRNSAAAQPSPSVRSSKAGQAPTFSRAELVGKFPEIKHQPAPVARYRLSEQVRDQLVSRMRLT